MDSIIKHNSSENNEQNSFFLEEFHSLFEKNLSIILILDPENGKIIEANSSAVEFYKYPKDKLLSMSIFEINILSQEEIMLNFKKIKNADRQSYLYNHKKADGTIHTVRTFSSKVLINNKTYVFSLLCENTQQEEFNKELETINKQLKNSLIFNQNLIQNASEGIIVYDKNLRYSLWNNFMVKATGVNASEVLGKKTTEIFNQVTRTKVTDGLRRALAGEVITLESVEFVNPITKISGFTREVFSPNYDSDGNIIGVVCIVSDITSIIMYQKSLANKYKEVNTLNQVLSEKMIELEMAKEKAEASDRLKSSFLAHVSHEIRTPLNSIVGFSTLIKDIKDPEKNAEYINIIQKNNLFLLNIIEDILTYSLIETKSLTLNFSEFDLVNWLQTVFNTFKQISTSKVSIALDTLDLSSLIIYTDESKLNQIISNLLTNAFKFTNYGKIELGIESHDADKVVLFVKDSGIGIEEENHNMIFTSFYKLDTLKPGSGLGLSIAKALCEMINGKITLKSELNKGSIFYIELPYRYINQGEENDR